MKYIQGPKQVLLKNFPSKIYCAIIFQILQFNWLIAMNIKYVDNTATNEKFLPGINAIKTCSVTTQAK